MNLLITSATLTEISPLLKLLNHDLTDNKNFIQFTFNQHKISILITGVGVHSTIFSLTRYLERNRNFDLALNTGLCGSFDGKIRIGDTVCIREEQFADIGIDDNGVFIPVAKSNLRDFLPYPFNSQIFRSSFDVKPPTTHDNVKSITVCNASGSDEQIFVRKRLFSPDVENMEGAAFFAIMQYYGIKFLEIRSVSNYVEPRNRENWDIALALSNLARDLLEFLDLV